MSTTDAWTILKLINWTTDYLKKSGSSSPRLDTEVLLAHACGCQRIELYTSFDKEPGDEVRTSFREMVRRRAEGMPVAYLVGSKEFYALSFEVTPQVLIPRPETEHLVVEALDRAKPLTGRNLKIADVGTGSGVIAVCMAKNLPTAQVIAIDLSEAALEVARRNAVRHGLHDPNITFAQSDLLDAVDTPSQFDLILSNPPYVSEAEYEQLPQSVRGYEPKAALVAGPVGNETIVRLLAQARERLVTGGFLIFEFSPMLNKSLADWLGSGWAPPHITKDLAGHARIVTLRRL